MVPTTSQGVRWKKPPAAKFDFVAAALQRTVEDVLQVGDR